MHVCLKQENNILAVGTVPVNYRGVRVFRQKRIHQVQPEQKPEYKAFEIELVGRVKAIIINTRKDIIEYFWDLKPIF